MADACPRNDHVYCVLELVRGWHRSTGGQCPGQTGTCATVCPHHRSYSHRQPGAGPTCTTCSVLTATLQTSPCGDQAALGGTTDHSSSYTYTPSPGSTHGPGHGHYNTLKLLATVEISAHILHNEWHSGPRAMIRGSKCNLTQLVNSVVRRES